MVIVAFATGASAQKKPDQEVYLFSYFKGNGEDGLHLAYSTDGLRWDALKGDSSFLHPMVSKDKIMRDPCIIRGADHLFHMVWTDSWTDKGIGYASSPDLIHWSEQQQLPVMEKEEGARNCWAPEITYDVSSQSYMIYWATTIPGRFPLNDSLAEGKYNHRIYYVTTKDFKSFSSAKLLFDPGYNVIDATIVPDNQRFILFFKDETRHPVQKNIRIAYAGKLTGPYSKAEGPITGNYWAEGPTTVHTGGKWIVYFDKYLDHKFGAVTSRDLKNWTDISDQIKLPNGIRHGTIFKITAEELAKLQSNGKTGKLAPKPLFRDPVFDGAADPTVIWNRAEKKWFMFYTNRRAKDTTIGGVAWVHGTRIGIAESSDGGATWKYRDTADIGYRSDPGYTFWAPEVIDDKGVYHMYLTYVPGVFTDWDHPRVIIHLTSNNLLNWKYESTLQLVNGKVIDPCVMKLPDGTWRMWYNNEKDGKSIYYANSPDLYNWRDGGKAVHDQPGEGPKVFKWRDKYWMITDIWQGLAVYSSDDRMNWTRQKGDLLAIPGKGTDDGVKGGHCDVVISGDNRAYLFYFTHPGRIESAQKKESQYNQQRSSIQVVELNYANGMLSCNRDEPTYIQMRP